MVAIGTGFILGHHFHGLVMSISPPIIRFGGKSRLAARVVGDFSEHSTYIKPFGGSAGSAQT